MAFPGGACSYYRVGKLYFILGCTAVGKGAVGRELAGRLGGRIVSADSMKVYRRMDVGTAKPSPEIRRRIPHYCIDLVEPAESFSVALYVEHADRAVAEILACGAVPLAVGGTSLYIKALSEGLFEAPPVAPALRAELRARIARQGTAAMHAELACVDGPAAERIHPNDAKRILRAMEVYLATGQPISRLQAQWDAGRRRYDCVLVGLRRQKEDLHARISARVQRMMDAGLVDEVRSLLAEPGGLSQQAAQAVGYAEVTDYLQGRCDLDQAAERTRANTRRLAKKQRTWHRRWGDVLWFDVEPDEPPSRTADRITEQVAFK